MLNNNKKIATLGILVSLSLILGYIEFLVFPDIMIPGVKIGLSNLCVLLSLYLLDVKSTICLGVLKVILSSILFSGINALVYGLMGIVLSMLVMSLLKKTKRFSIIGISIAGAVFHNIGQLIAAIVITETMRLLYYGPILLISGIFCGFIIALPGKIIYNTFK